MATAAPYGEQVSWQPATPRLRPLRLVISWIVAAASIWVAAAMVPGVSLERPAPRSLVAALIAVLNAILPAGPGRAAAAASCSSLGFLLVLVADALMLAVAAEVLPDAIHVDSFGWALLAALVDRRGQRRAAGRPRHQRRRRVLAARHPAHRPPAGRAGSARDVPGHRLPRDRRARPPGAARALRDGNAPTMARWLAEDGYRLAEWETDLSSQTGASQAGILLGSNEDIPAFRWVEKETRPRDGLLGAAGLRRDRAAPRDRARAAGRRRREPRQPALRRGRRGDPHGQPDARRRSRRTRATGRSSPTATTSRARSCCSCWEVVLELTAAAARGAARRAPARPPRRHLSAHARGDVRLRARPDRVRRAHRHDARTPRGVRDVLELRRGRPPLRPRARRHAGGAAQARPAVRPHRAGPPLRAAAVRDRRPLRPRPDAGRDLQAAQRLRPRRARRAVALDADASPGSRAATSRTRWSATPSARRPARKAKPKAKNDVSDRDVVVLGSGNLGLVYLMEERPPAHARGDRRAPPRADPRPPRTPARRLAARPLVRARRRSRSARDGVALPRRRPRRGRRSARAVLAQCGAPPAAHRRLRARRRHHGRQLLRPRCSTRAARSRS